MHAQPALEYDFLSPQKILFGWGRRREIGTLTRSLIRTQGATSGRAFVIWGSRTLAGASVADELFAALAAADVQPLPLGVIDHEPLVEDVDHFAKSLVKHAATANDLLIAIGGGAAIDLAKAAGAMATSSPAGSVVDYLEGVGRGLTISAPPPTLLAIPTTAGTGAEATKNAVISSYDPPFKKSLRSEWLLPKAVLVDPELTVSLPVAVTAHSGLDAITQLIESYISRRAQPIPQSLARDGLRLAAPAILIALRQPHDRQAREAMAHAALLSGMALANSGLGLAHGVAAALGVHCRVAHGLACGFMLPLALRANRPVCTTRYAELAAALGLADNRSPDDAADSFVATIEELCREVGLPARLRELGVRPEQIPAIVRSSRGNSMDGNPRHVTDEELTQILEQAL